MIDKLNPHYSFTNPASVHDEEAMTALELAGRQGAKINEVVDETNKAIASIPGEIKSKVDKYIEDGEFDKAIDEHLSDIDNRVDNLVNNIPVGGTTMDAQIIDAHHNAHKETTYENLKKRLDDEYIEHVKNASCVHGVYFTKTPKVTYHANTSLTIEFIGETQIYYAGGKYTLNDTTVTITDISGALYKIIFNPDDNSVYLRHHSEKVQNGRLLMGIVYERNATFVNELTNSYNDYDSDSKPFYANIVLHDECEMTLTSGNTYSITLPTFDILFNKRVISTVQTTTLSLTLTDEPKYLYVDLDTLTVDKVYSSHSVCIGYVNRNGFYLNALNQIDACGQSRCVLLGSPKSKFIAINTALKTITFPADMLVIYKGIGEKSFGHVGNSQTDSFILSYADLTTSAINIWINRKTHIPFALPYYSIPSNNNSLLFTLRTSNGVCDISVPYTVDGKLMNIIPLNAKGEIDIPTNGGGEGGETIIKSDESFFYSIAHRGLSGYAPENTLPAFELAKENGFKYVECDVRLTSDGVAVLIHDETVDRTSNGTGKVSELTYAQLLELDFGSWFSPEYSGTKVLKLQDFLIWCRDNGMIPFIECKEFDYQLENWLYAYGLDKTAFVGGFDNSIVGNYVQNFNVFKIYDSLDIDDYMMNSPFFGCNANRTQLIFVGDYNLSQPCLENIFHPFIYWTCDDASTIENLPKHISGVVSNILHGGKVKRGE